MPHMRKREFKIKKRYIVLVGLLLLAYVPFIATRYCGHTTYIPFSGRVFDINIEEVEAIRFQSGNTGRYIKYLDEDEVMELVDYLNSFRYRVWLPEPPRGAGWSYRIQIYFNNDEEDVSYYFNSFSICVNRVWFYGRLDYFRRFTDILNELPEEPEPSPLPISASDSDILPPNPDNPEVSH
jgi:hypothetical protein